MTYDSRQPLKVSTASTSISRASIIRPSHVRPPTRMFFDSQYRNMKWTSCVSNPPQNRVISSTLLYLRRRGTATDESSFFIRAPITSSTSCSSMSSHCSNHSRFLVSASVGVVGHRTTYWPLNSFPRIASLTVSLQYVLLFHSGSWRLCTHR